jgi:ribosomal subunit interface protein
MADARALGMHVYITARHFDLSDNIREHVQRRIVDTIEAHADAHDLTRVEVQLTLGQREARCACHVLVQLPGHRDINITEENHDLHAAIDLAEKRLLRCLIDLRERRLTTTRHPRKYSQRKLTRGSDAKP